MEGERSPDDAAAPNPRAAPDRPAPTDRAGRGEAPAAPAEAARRRGDAGRAAPHPRSGAAGRHGSEGAGLAGARVKCASGRLERHDWGSGTSNEGAIGIRAVADSRFFRHENECGQLTSIGASDDAAARYECAILYHVAQAIEPLGIVSVWFTDQ